MSDRQSPPPAPPPALPTEYFFERPPWNNAKFLVAIALIVSCFDFLAGPIVFFPVLFLVPMMLLAWNCTLRKALWLGALLCTIRFAIQYAWGIPYTLPVAIVNGVLRVMILFLLTFLCAKLSQQTQALRARVRTLEGILPTCCYCKDIRDDEGNWQPIEEYVASRSEAKFSHGICAKCMAKHHGDVLERQKLLKESARDRVS